MTSGGFGSGGVQSESRMAFAGLHELLRPVRCELDGLAAQQATALRRCLALEPGATDGISARVALTMLLVELARERPLLCVLDDAQWLDESSADAVLFATRRHPEQVGFVFGVREGLPSRFDESWLPQVSVGPLPDAESRVPVRQVAPRLKPAAVDRVVAAGEGIPLALVEFARWTAQGDRNREVAAALFVSEKTVETHLAAAYRKLGVRSRAQLAARLATAFAQEQPQGFS